MKNIKKRILALWMAVCMALTMMPSMAMPVWADISAEEQSSELIDSIEVDNEAISSWTNGVAIKEAKLWEGTHGAAIDYADLGSKNIKVTTVSGKNNVVIKYLVSDGAPTDLNQFNANDFGTVESGGGNVEKSLQTLGMDNTKKVIYLLATLDGTNELFKITTKIDKKTATPTIETTEVYTDVDTNTETKVTLTSADESYSTGNPTVIVYGGADCSEKVEDDSIVGTYENETITLTFNKPITEEKKIKVALKNENELESDKSSQITIKPAKVTAELETPNSLIKNKYAKAVVINLTTEGVKFEETEGGYSTNYIVSGGGISKWDIASIQYSNGNKVTLKITGKPTQTGNVSVEIEPDAFTADNKPTASITATGEIKVVDGTMDPVIEKKEVAAEAGNESAIFE